MDELKKKFNDRIRSLVPINGLAVQYQNEIIQQAQILQLKRRQNLFKQGDIDNHCFYLLEGELDLEANGQRVKTVSGGAPDAKVQLAQLQPRQLTATAKGKAVVLRMSRELLDRFLTMDDPGASGGEMEVSEVGADSDGDWMTRLLQSELFARIPPGNIQRVFAVLESVEVKPGEVVIEQDSVGEYYYIIQHGRCEVSRKTESSGRAIKLAELGDGDCFGEEALVSGAKRNATVTMITPGELMRLTKEDFIELIKKPNITTLDYESAKVEVAKGARWLDTRFPEEHGNDGIEGSVNIPLNSLRVEMKKLDQNATYIVYCDTGARSSAATFLLAQNGFDARHLEGGLYSTPLASAARPEPEPAPPPEAKPEPKPAAKPAPA
ncbi:MAG: cyclic nucleotide-binding domain-containing protein, partial [Gammaproteobacteria bacterium]|nr:cyclic nucleotide-binding domain-containing protein [Gammaproteobacteria bacterium]